MSLELNLIFSSPQQVTIQSTTGITQPLNFQNPLTDTDLQDIRWYLETYSALYTADVDDQRAQRIEQKLPEWGTALFNATFSQFAVQAAFQQFYQQKQPGRVLTIGASHPDILALPWELLHIPGGNFVFHSNPRISIRRQFNVGGGFNVTAFQPKAKVRLLFVISRPEGAGFIDPRSDAKAVLEALATESNGKVETEFLRPATMAALVRRLEDRCQPAIDIVHFDGHGVYDPDGRFFAEAKSSNGLSLTRNTPAEAANMGYLLFEDERGQRALISAEKLASMLNEQTVGLIVLSACQSAMVNANAHNTAENGSDDANDQPENGVMGSVAARLTHGGIPAVLAMTHSVLVTTTQALFAQFYQNLVRGQGLGEALDNARRHLYLHPERGIRLRGQQQEVTLRLQDWFLPALYQAGADTPLLTEAVPAPPAPTPTWGNLPAVPEAGFWGRSRELWWIERAFGQGTRRLTITGFGGQGKTALAQEAGRWLTRTGLFSRVGFVDYASYQGQDPVSYAVSTLSTVLDRSFLDAAAVNEFLHRGDADAGTLPPALLIILDNLEALEPDPQRALLTAAKAWSEAGTSRLLLTTRQPTFNHPDYPIAESRQHLRLPLPGLGSPTYPNDALDYFAALQALPPTPTTPKPDRAALVQLFQMVDFHPLSIGLLARQLKTRRMAEVGQRLAALLAEARTAGSGDGDIGNPLIASLNLSLDRLDDTARRWVPRLGVFQGGALEIQILQVLEVTEADWQPIRAQLAATGLIQAEYLPNINPPYLKFHPTLAPVLWSQLTTAQQADLQTRHRQRYYQLSGYLYFEDTKNPYAARAIARRELPNLLAAVNQALAAGDADAVDFVDNVNKFLNNFGLSQDRAALTQKLAQIEGEAGSRTWYLARTNQGEALMAAGRVAEALAFTEMLRGLGAAPSYEQCLTLNRIGRCLKAQGQAAQAAQRYREGLAVAEQLEPSDRVQRQRGLLHTDLGDVLAAMGDFDEARSTYEEALKIAQGQSNTRQIGVVKNQLGTLELMQSNLAAAETRYQEALQTFQQLGEPASEAVVWHQLGRVYEEARQWEAAEQHYRESARIKESQGMIGGSNGAVTTWNQLALVNKNAGRVAAAQAWYEKAIAGANATGDRLQAAGSLGNLANLLQSQPHPSPADLATARQHAEAALAIQQTLDPAAAEIWKTYNILAQIAEQQGQPEPARAYRQQARQAKAAFAGTQYELRQQGPLIAAVVAAVNGDTDVQAQLETAMERDASNNPSLIAATRHILNGERDEDTLVDSLDLEDSMIVSAILQGIADPSTLAALLSDESGA